MAGAWLSEPNKATPPRPFALFPRSLPPSPRTLTEACRIPYTYKEVLCTESSPILVCRWGSRAKIRRPSIIPWLRSKPWAEWNAFVSMHHTTSFSTIDHSAQPSEAAQATRTLAYGRSPGCRTDELCMYGYVPVFTIPRIPYLCLANTSLGKLVTPCPACFQSQVLDRLDHIPENQELKHFRQ